MIDLFSALQRTFFLLWGTWSEGRQDKRRLRKTESRKSVCKNYALLMKWSIREILMLLSVWHLATSQCLFFISRWLNQKYNFDHLGKALMSLFVLSSKDGWVTIMYHGLDAVGIDKQVSNTAVEAFLETRCCNELYFIFMLPIGIPNKSTLTSINIKLILKSSRMNAFIPIEANVVLFLGILQATFFACITSDTQCVTCAT